MLYQLQNLCRLYERMIIEDELEKIWKDRPQRCSVVLFTAESIRQCCHASLYTLILIFDFFIRSMLDKEIPFELGNLFDHFVTLNHIITYSV
jgi:hypothetical protein